MKHDLDACERFDEPGGCGCGNPMCAACAQDERAAEWAAEHPDPDTHCRRCGRREAADDLRDWDGCCEDCTCSFCDGRSGYPAHISFLTAPYRTAPACVACALQALADVARHAVAAIFPTKPNSATGARRTA